MARLHANLSKSFRTLFILLVVSLLLGAGLFKLYRVHAAQLNARSVMLSNSAVDATNVSYEFNFDVATAGTVGSVKFEFCSNSPLIGEPCTPPWGFDSLNATLSSQSGMTGFSINPSPNVNEIEITRVPSAATPGAASFTFGNIQNPADLGSAYVRVLTYASNNATGPETDSGGLAFAMSEDVTIVAEVPPYLTFCSGVSIAGFDCSTASGDFIDFGILSPTTANAGQSQMMIATNAGSGYSVRASGPTMTSGINVLPTMSSGLSQPGTGQFGMNLRANVLPSVGQDTQGPGGGQPGVGYNVPNRFSFNDGDVIAGNALPEDFRKYTLSYIVNVAPDQPPGVYATTLTYICLANF